MIRLLLLVAAALQVSHGFSPSILALPRTRLAPLRAADGGSGDAESSAATTATSLEEKMKSWEASDEEIRAATLGGVVPGTSIGGGGERTDAFDVGLYIAFPFMVISCLAFVFFPLLVGNIDVTSVGPPPTS
eukprot:CAMPEP_0172536284 /NCGR_PEP_ID=MMETSP1067-20121228/8078_1 /TAXON_ID=265564 ORGANISM="Thalassiosira punctigera, Strain Tpunct2005C2" /NCGR_SAMPLE_ID=MMETSP1067 /ASSEMBLY_ACC=CAM_ASM_000444 /LENGTH=131 /DNA_ID=CAMNT_0013321327 /DNA_START=9 /DNA_END=404 /DNA_ORIENTATION=-